MTEENNHDQYIVCSNCKCNYINDEEHINTDFGYTRLEERYKTCVKCRAKNKVHTKTYYEQTYIIHSTTINTTNNRIHTKSNTEKNIPNKDTHMIY